MTKKLKIVFMLSLAMVGMTCLTERNQKEIAKPIWADSIDIKTFILPQKDSYSVGEEIEPTLQFSNHTSSDTLHGTAWFHILNGTQDTLIEQLHPLEVLPQSRITFVFESTILQTNNCTSHFGITFANQWDTILPSNPITMNVVDSVEKITSYIYEQ